MEFGFNIVIVITPLTGYRGIWDKVLDDESYRRHSHEPSTEN